MLESLIAHREGRVDERTLQLVRMTVSFTVSCPFCVGMNSQGWESVMTPDELAATQGLRSLPTVTTFSDRERLAIEYARLLSQTPLDVPLAFGARIAEAYDEREVVVLASTIAQVNYWARLIQGLGCPPE